MMTKQVIGAGGRSTAALTVDDFNAVVLASPDDRGCPVWVMHEQVYLDAVDRIQSEMSRSPRAQRLPEAPFLLGYEIRFTDAMDPNPRPGDIAAVMCLPDYTIGLRLAK